MRTYAIGDVHGCNKTLQALLKTLDLRPGDAVVFLGDLLDRGPDSKGVVDTIWRLRDTGIETVCLRGNHEQMLLEAQTGPEALAYWYSAGGQQTLESFGTKTLDGIPPPYLDFFAQMPFWHETKGYLCVHGGVDFSQDDPFASLDTLLWMRNWYDRIAYDRLGPRIILHGHTPVGLRHIQEQHLNLDTTRYLNLDNGCVYARRYKRTSDVGRLMAFGLESRELLWQQYAE